MASISSNPVLTPPLKEFFFRKTNRIEQLVTSNCYKIKFEKLTQEVLSSLHRLSIIKDSLFLVESPQRTLTVKSSDFREFFYSITDDF